MNDDIKKMTALTTILFIATSLLLVILMMGYNYTFVKVLTGVHVLMFLLSSIGLLKKIKKEIISNKLQLELVQRYIYSGKYREEAWQEYCNKHSITINKQEGTSYGQDRLHSYEKQP